MGGRNVSVAEAFVAGLIFGILLGIIATGMAVKGVK